MSQLSTWTRRGIRLPKMVPEAWFVRSELETSAEIIELKLASSEVRFSTSSMPRSASIISALTMLTSSSIAFSSSPAANAEESSRVSFFETSPLNVSLHLFGGQGSI